MVSTGKINFIDFQVDIPRKLMLLLFGIYEFFQSLKFAIKKAKKTSSF